MTYECMMEYGGVREGRFDGRSALQESRLARSRRWRLDVLVL